MLDVNDYCDLPGMLELSKLFHVNQSMIYVVIGEEL